LLSLHDYYCTFQVVCDVTREGTLRAVADWKRSIDEFCAESGGIPVVLLVGDML
jgi:hypothetical protein